MIIKTKSALISLNQKALIMGIVNITPDSFSGDGILDYDQAIKHALKLIEEGADILDIGGESSKPGAIAITAEEEIKRILPIVQYIIENTNVVVSVDTYKPEVAEIVLKAGVHIINDITGAKDPKIRKLVKEYNAGLIIMHMQGDPQTMQINPSYNNVIKDISTFFEQQIQLCKLDGILEDQIILDPGIGFGKTLEHNLDILRNIQQLKNINNKEYPMLIGVSRKGFIGKLTDKEDPQDRVFGTAGAVAFSVMQGAEIVRVHDVGEIKDVLTVLDSILEVQKL